MGRRRHAVTGRFGLRPLPGGFGTPAFGPSAEVVRVSGHHLVHELDGHSTTADLRTASLADLALLVGVDLGEPFEVGHDTPDLGDVDVKLDVDPDEAATIARWYAAGATALDAVLAITSDPSVAQLWPEHFDLAVDVATSNGRVNLGVSPGDAFCETPYAYVGPWESARPGDPAFWNAPFGAFSTDADLVAFFSEGLRQLER